jgi:hypothetical protein
MSNVVEIKTRPAEVVASVIARLEEVLAEAREGKIVAVAIAGVNLDGSISSAWSETDDFGKLLGSVARLEHRININQGVE